MCGLSKITTFCTILLTLSSANEYTTSLVSKQTNLVSPYDNEYCDDLNNIKLKLFNEYNELEQEFNNDCGEYNTNNAFKRILIDFNEDEDDDDIDTVRTNKFEMVIGSISGFACPVFNFDDRFHTITRGQTFESQAWDLISHCGGHEVTVRAGRKKSVAVRDWHEQEGELSKQEHYLCTDNGLNESAPKELNFAIKLTNFRIEDRESSNRINFGTVVIGQGSYSLPFQHRNNWWFGTKNMRLERDGSTRIQCIDTVKADATHSNGAQFTFSTSNFCRQ